VFVDDNRFGVPAGWYPDPLGLPQLRWWDAQAWTEHTSEARAPIVIQPAATATKLGYADDDVSATKLGYADDDLPSRREQRERERRENGDLLEAEVATALETETGTVDDEISAQPLLAATLKELEPPFAEDVETTRNALHDDSMPGPRRASAHTNVRFDEPALTSLAEEAIPAPTGKKLRTYTTAVWAITIMPLVQLTVGILLITVLGFGHNAELMLVVFLAPYFIVLGLAAYDKLRLQTLGHKNPASAWWAALTEPVYLAMRGMRTFRETRRGFAPLTVFSLSIVAALATVLALPGLLIALMPAQFAAEVEQSVRADASALGADLTVSCPAPPLLMGETFTCRATKPSGDSDSIAVTLERQSGWINWRVVDWGVWNIASD
jgi:hypothetical protein